MIKRIPKQRSVKHEEPQTMNEVDPKEIFPNVFCESCYSYTKVLSIIFYQHEESRGHHHYMRTNVK